MAQPLQTINLVAPAFKGVNTEDSPLAQDPSFAEVADNAVIDKRGRIASRKGIADVSTNATELGSDRIHHIHHFYDSDSNEVVFSVGNNKIFSGTDTLTDETPASYTITDNNWKIVNFNDYCYFFQRGYEPLVYSDSFSIPSDPIVIKKMSDVSGASVTSAQYCHEALAAFGRLWVVGTDTDNSTIYWSDLLIGHDFTGGSSGSIDVSKAWPDGFDEIRAIAAHNNLLVIFGNHSILVYQNADTPASMSLVDTVAGVGAICRNSVQHIGTDVLFMSRTGLRSFGRTIQEKSMPLSDLSSNIKTELVSTILERSEPTASVYSPENAFYLIGFPDQNIVYCFDLRTRLENNSYRVTRWPSSTFKAFERKTDGTIYIGTSEGIGTYSGYSDNGESYRFRYYSPGLTFGDASKTKILKKIRPTIVATGEDPVTMLWGYDLADSYSSRSIDLTGGSASYFGEAEFGVSEYSVGTTISRRFVNTTGSGTIVTVGIEADISTNILSIQEINVYALLGKTL